jgi:RecA/RadA recombinase
MSNKIATLRKSLAKKEISTVLSQPDDWISFGSHALNYIATGSFYRGIPNRRLVMNFGQSGCVDGETEFLSPEGWKKISDYVEGDKVAQFKIEGESVEFVAPKGYVKTPVDEFFHLKSSTGINQVLSPEHRVLYEDDAGEFQTDLAASFVTNHNEGRIDGVKIPWQMTAAGTGVGLPHPELFVHCLMDMYPTVEEEDGNVQVGFLGKGNRQELALNFMMLLDDADYDSYMMVVEDGVPTVSFTPSTSREEWRKIRWNIAEEETPYLWDNRMDPDNGTMMYPTRTKSDVDFIQYLMNVDGERTDVVKFKVDGDPDPWFTIIEKGHRMMLDSGTDIDVVGEGELEHDGFKYCFAVPSGYLVMRRNGTVFITGNTGKSLIAGHAAKNMQEQGRLVIYIDTEDAIDPDYLSRIGVDVEDEDKFMPIRLSTIEELSDVTSDIFRTFDKTDKIGIIVDSLGMIDTKDRVEAFDKKGEMKNDMGVLAKKLKQYLRSITAKIGEYDCMFLANQHVYANQNVLDGRGTHVPSGGEAQIYIPSISLMFKKLKLKEDGAVTGIKLKAITEKTRFFQLGYAVQLEVPYATGIDPYDGVLEIIEAQSDFLSKSGAWYSYEDDDGKTVKFQKSKSEDHLDYLMAKMEPTESELLKRLAEAEGDGKEEEDDVE